MPPFFVSFVNACTSFKFYEKLPDTPPEKVLLFLVKAVLILTLLNTLHVLYLSHSLFKTMGQWTIDNLPPLEIREGTIRAEGPQPFWTHTHLSIAHSNQLMTIGIDTRPGHDLSKPEDPDKSLQFLVGPSHIIMRNQPIFTKPGRTNAFRETAIDARKLPEGPVDKDFFIRLFGPGILVVSPLIYVALLCFTVLALTLHNAFFTLVTGFMEKSSVSPLTLAEILKVCLCACVPALLVTSLYRWVPLDIRSQIIFILTFAIYYLAGLTLVRKRLLMKHFWDTRPKP